MKMEKFEIKFMDNVIIIRTMENGYPVDIWRFEKTTLLT